VQESTELIGLLAQACERLVSSVFAALDDEGFPGLPANAALAVRLLARGPATSVTLATSLGVTPQAAGRVTADLEQRGLVERGVDSTDARARPLSLTREGRRLAEALHRAEVSAVQQWASASPPADLTTTARALQAYLDASAPPPPRQQRRMRFT
jgi:DNA-binding MarR family transcriptional regulator